MIRNWLARFMIGRYGVDQFYFALCIVAVVLGVLSSIPRLGLLYIVSCIFLFYALFRMLSRNIHKRRRENDIFLRYWWPVRRSVTSWYRRFKSRKTHRFFKCPGCKNILRVPKGKGKIQITCPKCGERFERKT